MIFTNNNNNKDSWIKWGKICLPKLLSLSTMPLRLDCIWVCPAWTVQSAGTSTAGCPPPPLQTHTNTPINRGDKCRGVKIHCCLPLFPPPPSPSPPSPNLCHSHMSVTLLLVLLLSFFCPLPRNVCLTTSFLSIHLHISRHASSVKYLLFSVSIFCVLAAFGLLHFSLCVCVCACIFLFCLCEQMRLCKWRQSASTFFSFDWKFLYTA